MIATITSKIHSFQQTKRKTELDEDHEESKIHIFRIREIHKNRIIK